MCGALLAEDEMKVLKGGPKPSQFDVILLDEHRKLVPLIMDRLFAGEGSTAITAPTGSGKSKMAIVASSTIVVHGEQLFQGKLKHLLLMVVDTSSGVPTLRLFLLSVSSSRGDEICFVFDVGVMNERVENVLVRKQFLCVCRMEVSVILGSKMTRCDIDGGSRWIGVDPSTTRVVIDGCAGAIYFRGIPVVSFESGSDPLRWQSSETIIFNGATSDEISMIAALRGPKAQEIAKMDPSNLRLLDADPAVVKQSRDVALSAFTKASALEPGFWAGRRYDPERSARGAAGHIVRIMRKGEGKAGAGRGVVWSGANTAATALKISCSEIVGSFVAKKEEILRAGLPDTGEAVQKALQTCLGDIGHKFESFAGTNLELGGCEGRCRRVTIARNGWIRRPGSPVEDTSVRGERLAGLPSEC
jgi:hypothetical protein